MMGTIGDTISPEVLQDDITFIAKIISVPLKLGRS